MAVFPLKLSILILYDNKKEKSFTSVEIVFNSKDKSDYQYFFVLCQVSSVQDETFEIKRTKACFHQGKKTNVTNASAVIIESRPARTKRGIGRNQAVVMSLIRPLEVTDHNAKKYCCFSAFQSKHPL